MYRCFSRHKSKACATYTYLVIMFYNGNILIQPPSYIASYLWYGALNSLNTKVILLNTGLRHLINATIYEAIL